MTKQIERLARARADRAVAAGLAADRPEGVEVAAVAGGLRLSGPALGARWVTDPAVRAIRDAVR